MKRFFRVYPIRSFAILMVVFIGLVFKYAPADSMDWLLVGFGISVLSGTPILHLMRSQGQQELFLEILKLLNGAKTQTVLAGASRRLHDLVELRADYARPVVVALECSIREHSASTESEWFASIHKDLDKHTELSLLRESRSTPPRDRDKGDTCALAPQSGWSTSTKRPWTPAIAEMVDTITAIRRKHARELPSLQLSSSDLRSLSWDQLVDLLKTCSGEFRPIMDRVDLRHVFPSNQEEADRFTGVDLKAIRFNGAWVSLSKRDLSSDAEDTQEREDARDRLAYRLPIVERLLGVGAALYLEGNWSDLEEKVWKDDQKEPIFTLRGKRIGGAPGADFEGLHLEGCKFAHGFFMGANFRGAYLEGADFSGADISGADFTDARGMKPKMFRSARKWNTIGLDHLEKPVA